jgi:hypothetical protein
MNATAIATVVLAAVGVLSLLGALLAWLFHRGADEREFSVALRDNAGALRELAAEFRKFRDEVVDKVHGLDLRVTRLEVTPPPIQVTTKLEAPSHDSAPFVRDPGPLGGHSQG